MNMEPALSLPLIEQNVNPRVWEVGKSVDRGQNAIPIVVRLKDPHLFPHKKQYPLKPEVKKELKPIIKKFKGARTISSLQETNGLSVTTVHETLLFWV